MADALLSPAVGGAMWAGSLGTLAYSSRKLKDRMEEGVIPSMGVLAAFVFAAQMINFTIPLTGSSGHLGGGLLLAVLLGPHAAFLSIASVLVVQALFFADGGLLALGCNIWNLGLYPCFLAYPLVYRPLAGDGTTRRRVVLGSVVAAVVGLQFGAFSVVVQTTLSGITDLPFGPFLGVMQPIHLAIGLVEGFVTAAVILGIRSLDAGVLLAEGGGRGETISGKPLAALALAALIVGGGLSWFASENPDGLEWSIQRVTGSPELPASDSSVAGVTASLQEKTAVLPEYDFRAEDKTPSRETVGTSVSGIVGGVAVAVFIVGVGGLVRFFRSRTGNS